jgi:guanylate cyclase soluble subunit beta
MFNRSLEIIQAGTAILRLLQMHLSPGSQPHFCDLFSVVRPIMDFGFNTVLGHINTVFVVDTRATASESLRLKGQMTFVPESDAILYLCSPRVSNLDDMKIRGLTLNDIPAHDSTRDLILVTQARKHERELVEKLEETSDNLKKLQTRLQEDKQKTDELLHSILPSSVADKLRLGQPVEAEKFNLVTILFSDIVGFTAMCGDEKVVPIDIVRMLNRLYTQFDMLSSLNSVYKVGPVLINNPANDQPSSVSGRDHW